MLVNDELTFGATAFSKSLVESVVAEVSTFRKISKMSGLAVVV
jgi:hypothetical protein